MFQQWPNTMPTYPTLTMPYQLWEMQIRKVENGFVVLWKGKEYVFSSISDFEVLLYQAFS